MGVLGVKKRKIGGRCGGGGGMKDEGGGIWEVVGESMEGLIMEGVVKVGEGVGWEGGVCEKVGL